jgi:hypothetical protein
MEHKRYLGHHQKTKSTNHIFSIIIEEEKERQTKVIDNLFNKMIPENFSKFEKERYIKVPEAYRTPNHQRKKKKHPQTYKYK